MNLSDHFSKEEYELEGPMPDECVKTYTALSQKIMEGIREHCNCPLIVTSGYRSPEGNATVSGVAHSQHVATSVYCAADFRPASPPTDLRPLFDWIRLASGLPFDQVGLEWNREDHSRMIIHVSWTFETPRHFAFEGPEGGPYTGVPNTLPLVIDPDLAT
jgi:hypothetical protein